MWAYLVDLAPDGDHRVAEAVELGEVLGLGRLDHQRAGHREAERGRVEAEVDQALVVQVGGAEVQLQIVGQAEVGGRGDGLAVDIAVVAEGVAVLEGAGNAERLVAHLLIGPAGIELGAALAFAVLAVYAACQALGLAGTL